MVEATVALSFQKPTSSSCQSMQGILGGRFAESCCQVLCVWSLWTGLVSYYKDLCRPIYDHNTDTVNHSLPHRSANPHKAVVAASLITIRHDRILPPVFITPPSSYAIASFCMVMEKMMVALWWEVVVEIAAIANCSLMLCLIQPLGIVIATAFLSSWPSSLLKYMGGGSGSNPIDKVFFYWRFSVQLLSCDKPLAYSCGVRLEH